MNDDDLPVSFKAESEEKNGKQFIRANLNSMDDIHWWIEEYENITNTKWCVRSSTPSGSRKLCSKYYVCHHSSFRKVSEEKRKKGETKNSGCGAFIKISIKLNTKDTRKKDVFVKKGLCGVIELNATHNHSSQIADPFRFLSPGNKCKETFIGYFNKGMSVTEAHKYHQQCLREKEGFEDTQLANPRHYPMKSTIYYWYSQWKNVDLGPKTGAGMIEKVKEEILTDEESEVTVANKENPFGVLQNCESNVIANKEQLKNQVLKKFEELMERFNPSVSALEEAHSRLNQVATKSHFEAMLHALAQDVPLHREDEAAVHVQPTSRTAQITRGSKRLPSGLSPTGSEPLLKKEKT